MHAAGFDEVITRTLWEVRTVHDTREAYLQEIGARTGRSILHELDDDERSRLADPYCSGCRRGRSSRPTGGRCRPAAGDPSGSRSFRPHPLGATTAHRPGATVAGMRDLQVRLVAVDARHRADEMVAVHQAAASVAYAHIFPGPFPRAQARQRWYTHSGRAVLALSDGNAIRFAAAVSQTLEGLYVIPSAAGSGVGSALLAAVAPVTRLWVLEQNGAGRHFYESRGWCWSGVRRDATDAHGVSELLYEW